MEDVDEPRLTVSGAARRLGVAPATLRTWDRRYGVGPSEHARGRHRRYSASDMARLELMQHALVQGASPAEAARFARSAVLAAGAAAGSTGPVAPPEAINPEAITPEGADGGPTGAPTGPEIGPVPAVSTADGPAAAPPDPHERPVRAGGGTLRMPGAGARARGLGRAALAMDPVTVRRLLEEAIVAHGLVAAWNDVAQPVLVAVGRRWAATGRGVEVEHLLSDCVTAVFGARAAAAAAVSAVNGARAARPVLLAGMPDDLHVVPLAVLAAVLTARGVGCRLLGPALPADALAAAVRRTAPAAVVLWSQMPETADTAVIAALPVTRPRFRTYVAGPGWADVPLSAGVSRLTSLVEADERIGAAVLR